MPNDIGLAQALLLTQTSVFANSAPMGKYSPVGTLGMALSQNTPSILSKTIDANGYIRDVNIRSRKRAAAGETVTTDDCSLQAEPAYFNQTLPTLLKRYKGIFFEMSVMKQLEKDALARINSPASVPTNLMSEVWSELMNHLNGFFFDVNADLCSAIVPGKNAVTGATTSKTINFTQNTSNLVLNSGMTEVMSDAMFNELSLNDASIVGSGFINNYYLQNAQAIGNSQAGLNTSLLTLPKFYYDPQMATSFGANQFLVVGKDALQFVNVCYNRASAISGRFGTSEFGTITFPITDSQGNILRTLEFDLQIQEVDCPADQVIAGGSAAARGRGYKVIIGCHYGFVQIPTDAYKTGDRLTGVRDIFRYTASNS